VIRHFDISAACTMEYGVGFMVIAVTAVLLWLFEYGFGRHPT